MGKSYELGIKFNKDDVLAMAECHKDNPSYDSYSQLFDQLVNQYVKEVRPKGYVQIEGQEVRCLVSLGPDCDTWIKDAFNQYMYLEGMILNSLFDCILFEASNELYGLIKDDLEDQGFLSIRYEPGQENVSMEMQKYLFDKMDSEFDLDMFITEGYMLSPTKSMVYYYKLEDEDCAHGIDHDCSSCPTGCRNRKYRISLISGDSKRVIQGRQGENILEVLRRNHVFVDAPCGGKKVCGKCKIKLGKHNFDLVEEEKNFLGSQGLEDGYVLACYHTLNQDLEVFLDPDLHSDSHEDHHIETGYAPFNIEEPRFSGQGNGYGIAVDIGTTTLVVSLIDLSTGQVLGIKKALNPQKPYGADVISRIQYTTENQDHFLGKIIRNKIMDLSQDLIGDHGITIREMVVSGNTTMIYLLLDINPEKLAHAPFETVERPELIRHSKDLFGGDLSFDLVVLPWISAYVGGDIVSGIFATNIYKDPGNILLIDIGTNGEMVLKTDKGMVSAATAAGPAFEGANITCGMGSISGAICEIKASDKGYEILTLGEKEAKGINGSALVDMTALLLENGKVDMMGYMESPEKIYKDIAMYPADVRQVQLAKGAIHAGAQVLMDEASLSADDIDHVYIAGGFGSHMNINHAVAIGLIPKGLKSKVKVVGNSSLAGGVKYLLQKNSQEDILRIADACTYLELSSNMKFNNAYMDSMLFEKE